MIEKELLKSFEQQNICKMFILKNFLKENNKKTQQSCFTNISSTSEKRSSGCFPFSDYIKVGSYKYREQDILGKGYSSRVYKATSINKLDEKYAIKVINIKKVSPSSLAMINNEIEIHRGLNHPNIIKFYDAYKTQNYYYIITQYCPHGDLLKYLHQNNKLQENKAQLIIEQIISGCHYLATKNIIHRDLKPANIFLTGDTWKIGDFGFAIECLGDCLFDRINVGTPLYMPIESLKANKYSFKSDIFAIGIILYQMLTHSTPWSCQTEKQLITKMKTQSIKFPLLKSQKLLKFMTTACNVSEQHRLSVKELEIFIKNSPNPQDKQNNSNSFQKKLLQVDLDGLKNKTQPLLNTPRLLKAKPSELSTELSQNSENNINNKILIKSVENFKQKNYKLLLQQVQFCKFIYYMTKNIRYFPYKTTNSFLCLTLFKHLRRCINQLENPNDNFVNELTSFQNYQHDPQYKSLQQQIIKYSNTYQKQYVDILRNAQITTIRAVNQKFPSLSYTAPLDTKFYENYYKFIVETLRFMCQQISINDHNPIDKTIAISAQYQALHCMYLYCAVIEHKLIGCQVKKTGYFSNFSEEITMDYKDSKMLKNDYLTLRQKIANL